MFGGWLFGKRSCRCAILMASFSVLISDCPVGTGSASKRKFEWLIPAGVVVKLRERLCQASQRAVVAVAGVAEGFDFVAEAVGQREEQAVVRDAVEFQGLAGFEV